MLLFVDAKQTFDLIYIAQYASLYTLVSNQVYHIRVTFFSHVCKNTCKLWLHYGYILSMITLQAENTDQRQVGYHIKNCYLGISNCRYIVLYFISHEKLILFPF